VSRCKRRVQFSPIAQSEYFEIVRQATAEDTGPNTLLARQRLRQVNTAARFLEILDPSLDLEALPGILWSISSFTYEAVRLFYERKTNTNVLVIHLAETTLDPVGTYELFTRLVISGQFNAVMAQYGVSIPDWIQHGSGDPTIH
jgi:hypothetical protein